MGTAVVSFLFFLGGFVLIGVASTFRSQENNQDYLMAGRSVQPWLVALSAVATNNSGYMFIGQIGFTYLYGLASVWLMVGWILGDFTTSLFIHKKLRAVTEKRDVLSFGGALSRWHGTDFRRLRLLVGIITVVFLGSYAAAQFKAGSKALYVLFGWEYWVGAVVGSVIVLAYCWAGGIRASIWTDAAQSVVMVVAMFILLWTSVAQVGSLGDVWMALHEVSPTYMNWFPPDLALGAIGIPLWIVGWFFGGAAIIGMPHVMIRFMALDHAKNMGRVRLYYYGWFTAFYALSIGVGLAARLLIPDTASFDPELALPTLSKNFLPPVLVGLVLAGLFSATMSTADSLVLSCSAALTRDIFPKEKDSYFVTKAATVGVTALALLIALYGGNNVFSLVLISVSVLASAFGPLLAVYCLDRWVSENTAVAMMVIGVATAILWKEFGLGAITYEVCPGMLSGLLTFLVLDRAGWNPPRQAASQG